MKLACGEECNHWSPKVRILILLTDFHTCLSLKVLRTESSINTTRWFSLSALDLSVWKDKTRKLQSPVHEHLDKYVLQSAFLQLVVVRWHPCVCQQSLLNLPIGALQFGHVWMTSLHESMQKGIRQHPNQHLTKKIKHVELNKNKWILGLNTTKSTKLRQHCLRFPCF